MFTNARIEILTTKVLIQNTTHSLTWTLESRPRERPRVTNASVLPIPPAQIPSDNNKAKGLPRLPHTIWTGFE